LWREITPAPTNWISQSARGFVQLLNLKLLLKAFSSNCSPRGRQLKSQLSVFRDSKLALS